MNRRKLGYALVVAGVVLAAAGAVGLLSGQPGSVPSAGLLSEGSDQSASAPSAGTLSEVPNEPASAPSAGALPESSDEPSSALSADPVPESSDEPASASAADPVPEAPAFFSGTYESPSGTTYAHEHSSVPPADVPAFYRASRITVHAAENMANGEPADALLLELEAVPDREFTVIAFVEAERPIVPDVPENMYGLQWQLVYRDRQFTKSARRAGVGGMEDVPSDHFNARYEGFGDRAEVEFYGPPGTRYYAVLLTDGTMSALFVP